MSKNFGRLVTIYFRYFSEIIVSHQQFFAVHLVEPITSYLGGWMRSTLMVTVFIIRKHSLFDLFNELIDTVGNQFPHVNIFFDEFRTKVTRSY